MTLISLKRTVFALLPLGAGLFFPSVGFAEEATEPGRNLEPTPSQAADEDPDAVFRAYDQFARRERTLRLVGGAGGVVFGVATMGIGSFVANKTDTSRTPWLVVGGVSTGLSLMGMIFPSDAERLGYQHSSAEGGHSSEEARALEQDWAKLADSARKERIAGGVVGLLLGAGNLGTGIAFAAGAGDLSDNQQAGWGGLLMGTGVMMLSGSTLSLLMPSDAEASYSGFMEGRNRRGSKFNVKFDVGAAPSGVFFGATGSF